MNGPQYTAALPTILIMSSFDGQDQLGPSLISSLIQFLSMSYRTNRDTYYLLNNYRLLFVPNPNIEGAFNHRSTEKSETGEFVDPLFDFNYGVSDLDHKCFQTSTARLLAHVFKEYLIIGTLVLSKGKGSIMFPFGSKNNSEMQHSNDHKAFESIALKLSDLTPQNLDLNIQKLNTELLPTKSKGVGRFEEWIYTSSEDIKNVEINCFDSNSYLRAQELKPSVSGRSTASIRSNKDLMLLQNSQDKRIQRDQRRNFKKKDMLKPFLVLTSWAVPESMSPVLHIKDLMKMSLKLLIPGRFSHRSFVYRLQLGADNDIKLFPTAEDLAAKSKNKALLRKRAYNSIAFQFLKHFAFFVKKRMSIQDLRISKSGDTLEVWLKVEGCLRINDFQLTSDDLALDPASEDPEPVDGHFLTRLRLKSIKPGSLRLMRGDFKISVLCDYSINDDHKPFSNLIRSKVDPNYRVYQSDFGWTSTRVSQLQIHNFDVKVLERHRSKSDHLEDLFHHHRDDLVSLVPAQRFFAYVKDGFYLLFEYDYQARRVLYKIENLDPKISAKNIQFEDFRWEIKYYYENFDYSVAQHETDSLLNDDFARGSERSLEGFFALLGKSLHVVSVDQTNFFSTKSLIKVFEKDPDFGPSSGLPVPPEGLNCFSIDFSESEDVFYVSVQASARSADLHEVYLYTLKSDMSRVKMRFFEDSVEMYSDPSFNGFDQETLAKFQRFVGVIEFNQFNLLGQKVSIEYDHGKVYQTCHLGRRNPFYEAKDVLILWGQKHSFYLNVKKESSMGHKIGMFLMVMVCLGICIGIILGVRYFRKLRKRHTEQQSHPKVEVI